MKNKSNFSRRTFLGSLAGLGAASSLITNFFARSTKSPAKKPASVRALSDVQLSQPNGLNLIVIISDTFRWDYLRFNGNERIHTPNLDRLAADSVYFANCYADGLPTIPARRVMHTGKSILADRKKWRPLPSKDITLAALLGKAGFTTGFIVDTYHHFKPGMNFHQDFHSWEWIRGQENDKYRSGPREPIRPEAYTFSHLLNDRFRDRIIQYILNTQERQTEDDYFCARSCSAAARWLEQNKDNAGPFMLFIDMFDPHEPWDAPPRFQSIYREHYPFERMIFGYGVDPRDVRKEDIPVLIDLYSAEVTFMDHCIGKLIGRIKALGLYENTIIAFSTDHGTHLGEQGCVQKTAGLLNSCVARVPLILYHPDKRFAGKRVDALTSHIDFVPTFLSLLGVSGYEGMDGSNLWRLVTDEAQSIHEHVITGFGNFGAIRSPKWHYFQKVWGKDSGFGPALYDLESDPGELTNVVKQQPQVVAKLKRKLAAAVDSKLD
ncbi:sulfatase [candidate division KSB1 bacterium]|nr:sulfatase [candidate division KSB1 bacterium]